MIDFDLVSLALSLSSWYSLSHSFSCTLSLSFSLSYLCIQFVRSPLLCIFFNFNFFVPLSKKVYFRVQLKGHRLLQLTNCTYPTICISFFSKWNITNGSNGKKWVNIMETSWWRKLTVLYLLPSHLGRGGVEITGSKFIALFRNLTAGRQVRAPQQLKATRLIDQKMSLLFNRKLSDSWIEKWLRIGRTHGAI